MNEDKHGSSELPSTNLKSQIWADEQRETVNRKPQFVACSLKMTKPLICMNDVTEKDY